MLLRLEHNTKYWNFAWHVWHKTYYTSLRHESYRKYIDTWFPYKSRDWSSTFCFAIHKTASGLHAESTLQ